jgi:hypothetical protein
VFVLLCSGCVVRKKRGVIVGPLLYSGVSVYKPLLTKCLDRWLDEIRHKVGSVLLGGI